eukprot:jgi/Mesen1/9779/ME000007S09838
MAQRAAHGDGSDRSASTPGAPMSGGYHSHSGERERASRAMRGTTVLCVRKGGKVVIIADGQVTLGSEIIKPNVKKVRRLGESVIAGFAGATADAFTLFERLESRLEAYPADAGGGGAGEGVADRQAMMVVADAGVSLTITGNGDVLEPYDGVIGIGSGGSYALAAARALIDIPGMDAEAISRKAMRIAADTCIYTNDKFTMEVIEAAGHKSPAEEQQGAAISITRAEEEEEKEKQAEAETIGSEQSGDAAEAAAPPAPATP